MYPIITYGYQGDPCTTGSNKETAVISGLNFIGEKNRNIVLFNTI
jgi:hypothetical protein